MSLEQSLCYYLSPVELFFVVVICPMLLSFLGLYLTQKFLPSQFLKQSHDVTGPLFSTLGAVYGIFLAFVVSTMWQEFSNTGTNLVQEARVLDNLYFGTKALAPIQGELQTLLREYRDSVVKDEWISMAKGEANPETVQLLHRIYDVYMSYQPHNDAESASLHQSIQNLAAMTGLRASRIDDSSSGLLPLLWFVLLVGALVIIGFSFLFGGHNFKFQAVMTMLLTGVIFMIFFTIISLDFPFTGGTTISPEPLQSLELR
jgi:Ca2+/H+ antiporter